MKHIIIGCRRTFKNFTCFLMLSVMAAGLSAQETTDASSVKKQITLLNEQMEKAFNNNDMMAVAAFYSDDSEIVYSDHVVKGRKNLDNYWMSLKDKGRGWELTVVEIGGQGEFVYQLGRSDLKHMSGDREVRSVTNFVLIWKKQADGSYRIFRDYLTRTKFEKD